MIENVQLFLYGIWLGAILLFLYLTMFTKGHNIIKIVSFILYSQIGVVGLILSYIIGVDEDAEILYMVSIIVLEIMMIFSTIFFWNAYSEEGWKDE